MFRENDYLPERKAVERKGKNLERKEKIVAVNHKWFGYFYWRLVID